MTLKKSSQKTINPVPKDQSEKKGCFITPTEVQLTNKSVLTDCMTIFFDVYRIIILQSPAKIIYRTLFVSDSWLQWQMLLELVWF